MSDVSVSGIPQQADLEQLAAELGQVLVAEGKMLACAESCTGGWVAQCCTAIPGSSAWFERGFVTYANAAKVEMLGVSNALIAHHGAVSEAVAQAMVIGAMQQSQADYALAITGIAGPSGGSVEKPVGTVCFAWACRQRRPALLRVQTLRFPGDRQAIRAQAAAHALQTLHRLLVVLQAEVR